MILTKAQIVDSICNRLDISKARSIEVVESLFEIIKKSMADGEDVLITGFGKFCVKDKGQRRGRNPQTGEDLMLGSRRVVSFECSGILRERINRNERILTGRRIDPVNGHGAVQCCILSKST